MAEEHLFIDVYDTPRRDPPTLRSTAQSIGITEFVGKFKERYEQLAAAIASSQGTPPRPAKKQKTQNLLRDYVDSDDSGSDKISDGETSKHSGFLVREQTDFTGIRR
jgi:hypothetical protein